MAHFCIVSPPPVLRMLQYEGVLGSSHLVLAHDIVDEYKAHSYAEIFSSVKRTHNEDRLVILDNSVIELGGAVSLDLIVRAARIVKPEVIILPDVLEDAEKSIALYHESKDAWRKAFQHSAPNSFMYVPQGKTIEEFALCAEQSLDDPMVSWWGVPRNLVKLHGSRASAIYLLHALNPYRRIHMLGFSDDPVDDLICANNPKVHSIDSAVPLRLMDHWNMFTKTPPRGDWWEHPTWHSTLTIANLKKARNRFSRHRQV